MNVCIFLFQIIIFNTAMILRLTTYANFTKHTCFLFLLCDIPVVVWQVFHYLASMRSVKYTPPQLHLGVRSLRGAEGNYSSLKTQVRLRGCWLMIIQTRLRSWGRMTDSCRPTDERCWMLLLWRSLTAYKQEDMHQSRRSSGHSWTKFTL